VLDSYQARPCRQLVSSRSFRWHVAWVRRRDTVVIEHGAKRGRRAET